MDLNKTKRTMKMETDLRVGQLTLRSVKAFTL